jgi:ABC-type molybdate transport system substrate-binding protein
MLLAWDDGARADRGETLIVYCAAGLRKPVEQIAANYHERYGVKIELEFDGSGTLLAKMRGAPGRGHLYLAADETYIAEARRYHLLAEAIPVARQSPTIAVRPGNPKGIKAVADLHRSDVKLVLANPELASIGKVVKQLLTASGDWNKLTARAHGSGAFVSFVGTVNEAAQTVKIGSADASLIWDATAKMYELEMVSTELLARSRETATIALLKHSTPTAALRFARFLTSRDQGMPHFEEAGLQPITDADEWGDDDAGGGLAPEIPMMIGAMLKPGVEETMRKFEQREGVTLLPVYNGCGLLVAQIKTGQQADMYLACDRSFMEMVQDRYEPAVDVSRNRMVIVVPQGNPKRLSTLQSFAEGGLKLGLAHPVNSALGKLTDDLLRQLGLHEAVYQRNRVVHADAGHMLVNQMRAGSLDACVVYKSNLMSSPEAVAQLDLVELKQAFATQPFAVSKNTKHRYLLHRLLDALAGEETAERFRAVGFEWLKDGASVEPYQ